MLVINIEFLNGRFHSTPWGRNVNEGEPEWPPSPYRLVRAIIDAWKRKLPELSSSDVEALLRMLSEKAPLFYLPPASTSHLRVYQSSNEEDASKKQKIFDAFVVIRPKDKVSAVWPDAEPTEPQLLTLNQLLSMINYYGRSESWVRLSANNEPIILSPNCVPSDRSISSQGTSIVRVACPVPSSSFIPPVITAKVRNKKGNGEEGMAWLDALTYSSADMIKDRRSEPPAMEFISYDRQQNCFSIIHAGQAPRRTRTVEGVVYAMESKVLPRVTETLFVSDQVHRKMMGIQKVMKGDPSKVSWKFSGKQTDGSPQRGHRHVYILPQDRDGDGYLDHMLVTGRTPLDNSELQTLDGLSSLWQANGRPDIRLTPIEWGTNGNLSCTEPSKRFISITPFVTKRHYRKGRGEFTDWLAEEVKRECVNSGLPVPTRVEMMPALKLRGRDIRWLEFRRSRRGDEDSMGFGLVLEFDEQVTGPIALGYGSHFGLGQFIGSNPGSDPVTISHHTDDE